MIKSSTSKAKGHSKERKGNVVSSSSFGTAGRFFGTGTTTKSRAAPSTKGPKSDGGSSEKMSIKRFERKLNRIEFINNLYIICSKHLQELVEEEDDCDGSDSDEGVGTGGVGQINELEDPNELQEG